jgi:hypothetical protein
LPCFNDADGPANRRNNAITVDKLKWTRWYAVGILAKKQSATGQNLRGKALMAGGIDLV